MNRWILIINGKFHMKASFSLLMDAIRIHTGKRIAVEAKPSNYTILTEKEYEKTKNGGKRWEKLTN